MARSEQARGDVNRLVALITAIVLLSSCAAGGTAVEQQLTDTLNESVETLNRFTVDRQAQIDRRDMADPDVTLVEFMAAGRESNAIVDFSIIDNQVDILTAVVKDARTANLATINGVSVDDIELYANALHRWSIVEAPQGEPLYECLRKATADDAGNTPMADIMADEDAVDCLVSSLKTAEEAITAQEDKNTYGQRISRDWQS